jgi:putative transposase
MRHYRLLNPARERLAQEVIDEWDREGPRRNVQWIVDECARRAVARGIATLSRTAVMSRLKSRNLHSLGRRSELDDSAYALECVVIDYLLLDIEVRDEAGLRNTDPWLTVAFDVASGMVIGFTLQFMGPSVLAVALTVAMAALPKKPWLEARQLDIEWPASGIPRTLRLWGKLESNSAPFRQACERHGIRLEYRAQDDSVRGSDIHRHLGDLRSQARELSGATPTEIERWFAVEIMDRYHHKPDGSRRVTPIEFWGEYTRRCPVVAARDPARFGLDFLPEERVHVGSEGLRLHRLRYWTTGLRGLFPRGVRALVKYDPRDLSRVFVLLPDGGRGRGGMPPTGRISGDTGSGRFHRPFQDDRAGHSRNWAPRDRCIPCPPLKSI